MNRDIVLGVLFSLVLHCSLLWVGAHIRRDTVGRKPLPATLNLSIIMPSPSRGNPSERSSIQKVPRWVPTPVPIPLRSRPAFAKMNPGVSRDALAERVTKPEQAVRFNETDRTTPVSELISAPGPIWNARPIDEIDFSKQPSEVREVPSPTKAEKKEVAAIGKPSSDFTKSFDPEKSGSGMMHEAHVPDLGVSQIVEAVPDYANNPKPVYPKLAIRRGHEGTVTLLVEVVSDGSVGDVEVLESSGHAILDRSALKAVRKWRFTPGTKMGEPFTMKVKVPVVFRLKRDVSG